MVVGPFSFTIGDTSNFHEYLRGGVCTQVKQPKVLKFSSLAERLQDPGEILISDFGKFDRPTQLHVAFQALHTFVELHKRNPKPWNPEDAAELLKLTIEKGKTLRTPVRNSLYTPSIFFFNLKKLLRLPSSQKSSSSSSRSLPRVICSP